MVEGTTTKILTDTERTKLSGIETAATADQTGAEIKTAYEAEADTNAYTDAEKTKLAGIEASADVTDTANVTSAGALMDSEVDADLKTLALPANTTISTFGATLVDDLDAATARTTLGVDAAGTDNSTDVTLAGTPNYITIAGQVITRALVNLTSHITGILPVANGGTNNAFFGVSGPASSQKTYTFPNANTTIAGIATTQTLTNKRITRRVTSTASSATPTPDVSTTDQYNLTALAVGATFGVPTGTPVAGDRLVIRIKDNGTTRSLAYNAIYRAIGVTLPTATTASKTIYLGMIYNSTDTKWDVIAVAEEA